MPGCLVHPGDDVGALSGDVIVNDGGVKSTAIGRFIKSVVALHF